MSNTDLRHSPRVTCRYRVVSPDLPHFTAVSSDISQTGLQLETRGPLPLGSVVRLRMEPQMSDWNFINFRARVAWHAQQGQRTHRLGLEYVGLDEQSRSRLRELELDMKGRVSAAVSQLCVECCDKYVLGKLLR